MLFGHPWFDSQQGSYASYSLAYPFWNVIWAFLGGQEWIRWIPALHALLVSATFAVVCLRLVQWFPKAPLGFFLPAFCLTGLLLSQSVFLLESLGDTSFILFQFGLVITGIPGPEMSKRSPVFSWWLIFVHPEGWLAGLSRFLSAMAIHQDVSNRQSSVFWAVMALVLFIMAGVSLFDDAFPLVGNALWADELFFSKSAAEKWLLISTVGLSIFSTVYLLWRIKEYRNPLISPIILMGLFMISGFLFKGPVENICLLVLPVSSFLLGFVLMVIASELEGFIGPKATILGFILPALIVFPILFGFQFWQTKNQFSLLADKDQIINVKAEMVADHLNIQVPPEKKIWSRKVGRFGWYAPFHSFVDLEGKTAPVLSGFLKEKRNKVLNEKHLDSLILDRFSPDFLILDRRDAQIFTQISTFQMQYAVTAAFPPVSGENVSDTLEIWQRLNDYPLN